MSKKGAISYADEYLFLDYEPKDDELLCAFKVTTREHDTWWLSYSNEHFRIVEVP